MGNMGKLGLGRERKGEDMEEWYIYRVNSAEFRQETKGIYSVKP